MVEGGKGVFGISALLPANRCHAVLYEDISGYGWGSGWSKLAPGKLIPQ